MTVLLFLLCPLTVLLFLLCSFHAAKLVPVGYGIRKLVITCVVEDDKVSTDDLEEQITGFEDYVSSTESQTVQE